MKKGVVVFLVLITLFSQLILSQIDCTFSSMKEYCHESGDIVYEYLIDRPDLEGCFYGIMPKERCGAGCEESGCIVIPCSSDNGCSRGMMCDPEKQICISKKSCRLTDECRYDETCEGGYCRKIECCGILRNHTCSKFKCCEDSDCPGNMNCISEFNTCGYVPACTAMVENGRSDEILDICLISDNMMEIESFTKTSLDTAGLNIWGYVLPSMDIKKLAENETLALETINKCPQSDITIYLTGDKSFCRDQYCFISQDVGVLNSFLATYRGKELQNYGNPEAQSIDDKFLFLPLFRGKYRKFLSFILSKEGEVFTHSPPKIVLSSMPSYAKEDPEYTLKLMSENDEVIMEKSIGIEEQKYVIIPEFIQMKNIVISKEDETLLVIPVEKKSYCNFDLNCEDLETIFSCASDCLCGNQVCDEDENYLNCPYDCRPDPLWKQMSAKALEYLKEYYAYLLAGLLTIITLVFLMKRKRFNKAVIKYVDDARAKGFSDDMIRNKLVQHGYPLDFIDKHMKKKTREQ